MSNETLIKLVEMWVSKIGKGEAVRRLVLRKVPPVTADKICSFRYHSQPRELLADVLADEMAKDGIKLGAAS